jgi:hypothetical protein
MLTFQTTRCVFVRYRVRSITAHVSHDDDADGFAGLCNGSTIEVLDVHNVNGTGYGLPPCADNQLRHLTYLVRSPFVVASLTLW